MNRPVKTTIPTKFGEFNLHAFSDLLVAISTGEMKNQENVLVRVHSACLTGEVLGSKRCDCKEQLEKSLELISEAGEGLVIYLGFQEGRGIGLLNKIKAYELQDKGSDTVEANHQLGFPSDKRTYGEAKKVLDYFGIKKIKILTNNPEKIKQIENNGIKITERIPLKIPPNEFTEKYLRTKKEKMGHFLD